MLFHRQFKIVQFLRREFRAKLGSRLKAAQEGNQVRFLLMR